MDPQSQGPPSDPDPEFLRTTEIVGGMDKIGCMAVIGLFLCHTVIGAVIGIPILIVAVALSLFDTILRRIRQTTGTCPFCQTNLSVEGKPERCVCHACGRALTVSDGQFCAAPD